MKTWKEFGDVYTYKDRFDKTFPEGETFRDVAKRMANFIYDIDSRYEGKTILIVSHQAPIMMLELLNSGRTLDMISEFTRPERHLVILFQPSFDILISLPYHIMKITN